MESENIWVFMGNYYQPFFFDEKEKLEKLTKLGDPLVKLKRYINFDEFGEILEKELCREGDKTGRPPYNMTFKFKILILQRLYNFSDEEMEYQINDRQSLPRFLGLHMGSRVPDYTTIWRYREELTKARVAKKLFDTYARKLEEQGVITRKGTIIDASFIEVPIQRNSKDENEIIKDGGVPFDWKSTPRKLSQKDVDARWAQKNDKSYYGYKDHDVVDAESKMIRDFDVSPADVHDSQPAPDLIREKHKNENLFADSAYKSQECDARMKKPEINNFIHEKAARNKPLNELQKQCNKLKSSIRCRIEHVFGHIEKSMGGPGFEYIGLERIKTAVGLRNLTYNFVRYVQLIKLGIVIHPV
jgi:IS5 family transposase